MIERAYTSSVMTAYDLCVKTVVLISAIVALAGALRVTRFFYLKRYGPKSVERRLEEERELEDRRHQDQ